jgi:hypothetical protein
VPSWHPREEPKRAASQNVGNKLSAIPNRPYKATLNCTGHRGLTPTGIWAWQNAMLLDGDDPLLLSIRDIAITKAYTIVSSDQSMSSAIPSS